MIFFNKEIRYFLLGWNVRTLQIYLHENIFLKVSLFRPFWSQHFVNYTKSDRSGKNYLTTNFTATADFFTSKQAKKQWQKCGFHCNFRMIFHGLFTLQTNRSKSAWQVKSMDRRKSASFCTTEIQRSCASVKGSGSISGVSFVVDTSVSKVERGHSAVRRKRIKSLKCCRN